jgi:hypothetical protein
MGPCRRCPWCDGCKPRQSRRNAWPGRASTPLSRLRVREKFTRVERRIGVSPPVAHTGQPHRALRVQRIFAGACQVALPEDGAGKAGRGKGFRAAMTFFFGGGSKPSRCAFFLACLRARRTASDFSRALRSDGFS